MHNIKRLKLLVWIGWIDLAMCICAIVAAAVTPTPTPTGMEVAFGVFLVAHTAAWIAILVPLWPHGPRGFYKRWWMSVRRDIRVAVMWCELATIKMCVFLGINRLGLWLEDKYMYLHRDIELQRGEEWFEHANGVLDYGEKDYRWKRTQSNNWNLYKGDADKCASVSYDRNSYEWVCDAQLADGWHYNAIRGGYRTHVSEVANEAETIVGVWKKGEQ